MIGGTGEIILAPSLIGLAIKICFLIVLFKRKASIYLINLVGIIAIHNLCEFGAIASWIYAGASDLGIKSYYATSTIGVAAILLYVIEISKIQKLNKAVSYIITCSVAIALLILATNLVISGSEGIGYSITAIKGNHYYIFQIWSLICFLMSFTILFYSLLNSEETQTKINSCFALLAFLPVILTGITILVLMNLDFKVNASLVMPFATTIFVWLVSKTRESHEVYDIRQNIPLSSQWHLSRQVKNITNQYMTNTVTLKEAHTKIEKLMLEYTLDENQGNITKTAEALNIPRSTVYSKFRK